MAVAALVGLGGLVNPVAVAERQAPAVAIAPVEQVIPAPGGEGESTWLASNGDSTPAPQRRAARLPIAGAVVLLGGLIAGTVLWLGRRSPPAADSDAPSASAAIAAELPPVSPGADLEPDPAPPRHLATTRLSREDIVDSLVSDLADTDGSVRRHAVWELGQRGNSDAIAPLINRLLEADSQEKSLILAALTEISSRSLKPMHRALALGLQDPSPEVRKNAIRDLSRVYDTVVQLSAMLAHAAQDPDPSVQETARWALGQLNRIPAAPYAPALPTEATYEGDRLPPG